MDKLQLRMQYRQAMAAAAEHQKLPVTAMMNLAIYRVYACRLREWSKGALSEEFDACSFDVEDGDIQMEEYEESIREQIRNVPSLDHLINPQTDPSEAEFKNDSNDINDNNDINDSNDRTEADTFDED